MAGPANKTPPEVEAEAVRLIREGRTRSQVSEATGVSTRVLSRIARDAGVEWARVGSGSHGTPEAMARARGVQSQYARNRRAALSERILDETERTLDLLQTCTTPRERQYLSQALRNHSASYSDLTQADMNAAPDMSHVQSMLGMLMIQLKSRPDDPDQRVVIHADGTRITHLPSGGTFEE